MGDLLLQAAVLGTYEKLSTAETFAAITCRSASVLRLSDRGVLEENSIADFIVFPTKDYRDILYHQGKLKPLHVWKRGEVVVSEE
jgi:imidazolonepropionase